MGIHVPEGEKAWIRVGPETRRWKEGECLLYDTTYEHETMNEHPEQERVVLHVDFFNSLVLTPIEIEVLQYIYGLREQFMKAEGTSCRRNMNENDTVHLTCMMPHVGVSKVGKQIL